MMEHYIGVDLHKAFFQACAVDESGAQFWEDRFPRSAAGIAAFVARCSVECGGRGSQHADVAFRGRDRARMSASCGSSMR